MAIELNGLEVGNIDFKKGDGLVPVIVQDSETRVVLMLGYMNAEAFTKTIETELVTFYSRSRSELWTKGETSGNTLSAVSLSLDCDKDTLLVKAKPAGPICHTGTDSCFAKENKSDFLASLVEIIKSRKSASKDESYVAGLFEKGTAAIAQKVGEEATEVVIESMQGNKALLVEESADLFFHLLVLLEDQGVSFQQVIDILEARNS